MSGKSDQTGNGAVTSPSGAPGAVTQPGERIWIAVFIFGFLGLMVDGMDFMFLSYSLPSLMPALGLSKVEAGSLGSYSLMGMALGGMLGGWCADRYGRVLTVVMTMILFSVGTAFLGLTQNYWQFAVVRFIQPLGSERSMWSAIPLWPSTCLPAGAPLFLEPCRPGGQSVTWPPPSWRD